MPDTRKTGYLHPREPSRFEDGPDDAPRDQSCRLCHDTGWWGDPQLGGAGVGPCPSCVAEDERRTA